MWDLWMISGRVMCGGVRHTVNGSSMHTIDGEQRSLSGIGPKLQAVALQD